MLNRFVVGDLGAPMPPRDGSGSVEALPHLGGQAVSRPMCSDFRYIEDAIYG